MPTCQQFTLGPESQQNEQVSVRKTHRLPFLKPIQKYFIEKIYMWLHYIITACRVTIKIIQVKLVSNKTWKKNSLNRKI